MDKIKEDKEFFIETSQENELNEFRNEFNSQKLNINKNDEEILVQFDAYFYFKINGEKEYIFPIKSDLFNINDRHVYELIKNIIKKINEKHIIINYNDIKYIISLKDLENENDIEFYIKNYEFKPCKKKNFMPKNDSPSYSSNSLLKNIDKKFLSFVSKSPLNIMLIEQFETNENEGNNKYQFDDDEDY